MDFDLKSISQFNAGSNLQENDLLLIQRGNNFLNIKGSEVFGFVESRITLSTTQIQNLHSTPIEIIPAKGSGTFLVPAFGAARLNYNGTAYTSGNNLRLKYTGDTDANFIFGTGASFINATDTIVERMTVAGGSRVTYEENTGVSVFVNNANPTGAGGTINIYVLFKIITF